MSQSMSDSRERLSQRLNKIREQMNPNVDYTTLIKLEAMSVFNYCNIIHRTPGIEEPIRQ